jgi:hypothetical protein
LALLLKYREAANHIDYRGDKPGTWIQASKMKITGSRLIRKERDGGKVT